MSELQRGLNPECTLEEAYNTFEKLVALVMKDSTWTPWHMLGGFFGEGPKALRRNRSAASSRKAPATYLYEIAPRYNDPAWGGPLFSLGEAAGTIWRQVVVHQAEGATYRRGWRRENTITPETSRYDISFATSRLQVPEFDPRQLTATEEQALKPYGGSSHRISLDQRDALDAKYIVEKEGNITISKERAWGSFSRGFGPLESLPGLIDLNHLLYDEVCPKSDLG